MHNPTYIHLHCRGCLYFNYEGDGDITKTNSPHCFLCPRNHQRNFIPLWKLQGSSAELLDIMKRHWLVCADLIEWSAHSRSRGTLMSGRTGSLLTANSLFSPSLSLLLQSWLEIKRENGNESRTLSHLRNIDLWVQTGQITWWFLLLLLFHEQTLVSLSSKCFQISIKYTLCKMHYPNTDLTCTT